MDDLLLALVHPDTEAPAHFECVLRAIREDEQLEHGEQICYVGGGVFAVVRAGRGHAPASEYPLCVGEHAAEWRTERSATGVGTSG